MKKFVFFDVGGVLIKDFSANDGWSSLKNALGLASNDVTAFDAYWSRVTPSACTTLDVDDLLPEIQEEFGIVLEKDFSLLAEFVERFEKSGIMQSVCDKVSEQHSVGLLTNMYPRMFDAILEKGLLPSCDWQAVVDSSRVKTAKPDARIFRIAEEMSGVSPADILFVDNTMEHLKAAESLGWSVFHFDAKQPDVSAQKLLEYLSLH